MESQSFSIHVSDEIGDVSAAIMRPEKTAFVLTLAHGAGAGMNHSFMLSLAQQLAASGIATLRFNFPFIEQKKKRVDAPPVAHKTVEAAIQYAHEKFADVPIFVSGKSFGGRMSSQFLSLHHHPAVRGIIFYGFPLHPAGKPSVERAEHLKQVKVPMLFLQGTRDELATWELIESTCAALPAATLIKIEGADHAFKAGKTNVMPLLVESSFNWMEQVAG